MVATVEPTVLDEMLLWWNKNDFGSNCGYCGSYCGYCGDYCRPRNATVVPTVATVVTIINIEMLLW